MSNTTIHDHSGKKAGWYLLGGLNCTCTMRQADSCQQQQDIMSTLKWGKYLLSFAFVFMLSISNFIQLISSSCSFLSQNTRKRWAQPSQSERDNVISCRSLCFSGEEIVIHSTATVVCCLLFLGTVTARCKHSMYQSLTYRDKVRKVKIPAS